MLVVQVVVVVEERVLQLLVRVQVVVVEGRVLQEQLELAQVRVPCTWQKAVWVQRRAEILSEEWLGG